MPRLISFLISTIVIFAIQFPVKMMMVFSELRGFLMSSSFFFLHFFVSFFLSLYLSLFFVLRFTFCFSSTNWCFLQKKQKCVSFGGAVSALELYFDFILKLNYKVLICKYPSIIPCQSECALNMHMNSSVYWWAECLSLLMYLQ